MKLRTALVLLLLAAPAFGAEHSGPVVAVADGDTLTALTPEHEQVRIRLAGIDAPEHGQPFGLVAKNTLGGLAFGTPARVAVIDHDRYGRTVGLDYVGGENVNARTVRDGTPWVFTRYNDDPELPAIEVEGPAMRRGL